ncbi:uncharacterized protein EV420DRAFT_1010005 [Desarmillaria tabescens]|uniref:Protein kinase domain-containing protein n=1 Tax=Armillaria tabescens TaxID=1929756 RepID=A0AA39MRD9_ARMTA|nr:uncharacterized protein EV420DRAFT_1010005 [Desarmillaria tabescens]KAK0444271.1 hypothetical protein EV420DRAFT_1010005 [Desarmillaria tabescens]
MSTGHAHKHSGSVSQNQKAQLANAYNELGKELASHKVRVVGNYTLGKVIGEGAYGKVRMGTHRLTSTRVAIKQIPKSMSATLTREIHHHRQLHHPHVAQMYEVIATESSIWIVTELCSGGELFDYLVEKGRLSEDETKVMFGQLCLAVAYLHEKGIVHRDLKLENVLLDERCKVKLGDFGFTREFERGTLMETFCGTTGYASPEMLQGKKYQGPEVDVWSLGIILYCLLTGTLPFDDDDEAVMRQKIIKGDFEDPEWLSIESRDLIKNILVMDPAKRLTIPQILTHSWFGTTIPTFQHESPIQLSPNSVPAVLSSSGYEFPSETSSPDVPLQSIPESNRSSEASSYSNHSASTFHSTCGTSPPTTPDRSSGDSFEDLPKIAPAIHANPSETTIRRPLQPSDLDSIVTKVETVMEEEADDVLEVPSPPQRTLSSSSKAPPVHSVRTPARTKRRSVSSQLSDGESPIAEKAPTLPTPQGQDVDFSSLLSTPAPIIFSTPLEQELLNSLSMLGFDLGQIVYSVLNDACDAAGALWWMLKRKAEKKLLEDADNLISPASVIEAHIKDAKAKAKHGVNVGTQTDPTIPAPLTVVRTTPQFAIVPPTPTFVPRPMTPPRSTASPTSRTLSPSSSMVAESSRSHPTTPAGSMKEPKVRKPRSGSVSIMQRATTALEAAGLVRKKSSEAVKEDRERDRDRERFKEAERKSGTLDEPRSSHGSSSSVSKLTKSPPMRATKGPPTTPPPHDLHQQIGSPWVLTNSRDSSPRRSGFVAPTPANSPGDIMTSASAPNLTPTGKSNQGSQRNRANLLTAFRLWFHEDRKGKRKENAGSVSPAKSPSGIGRGRPVMSASQSYSAGSIKRRTSGGTGGKFARGGRHRAQRGSISSRRSSSVNSRRSSVNSVQMIVLDSPHVPGMRSFGSHTPNSERGEYSSRPSSIRSISKRHRKSPSASSAGSTHFRTASPMQKYHRRGGSGSSTRVVRQVQTRPAHVRSNSTTSSLHSPCSSRPTSFHEFSDNEGFRAGSPFRPHSRRTLDETPRRSGYSSGSTTYFQKRHGLFSNPVLSNSIGRSSWKKSWGLEPPGWQTRTAHLPVEVLSISPAAEGSSIRDVFSGRQSLNLGDESDWVDEDDDVPYAGGLGQIPTSSLPSSSAPSHRMESPVVLSPAPRGHRNKRAMKGSNVPSGSGTARQKVSERSSPVSVTDPAPEARGGRRQLPTGRAGSAFRQAIQEEDEEEEEE